MSENDRGLFGVGRRTFVKGLGAAGLAASLSGSASASPDAKGSVDLQDAGAPYKKYRFMVEIGDIDIASFSRVDLPDAVANDVEYREGNGPPRDRKLKGQSDFEPLLLERGVTDSSIALFDWFKKAQDGKLQEARKDIAVTVLNDIGEPGARWEFRRAWPARYEGPDLNAMEDGVAVETLEIVHEGMDRVQ